MYDPKTDTIYFPHVLPGVILGSKRYTTNDIDGGMKKIADLGLQVNAFLGGNCIGVGLITSLGLYGCVNRWNNQLMAFYVHDGNELSAKGRSVVEQLLSPHKVSYLPKGEPQELTPEEMAHRQELMDELVALGVDAPRVGRTTAHELEALLKAFKAGPATKRAATSVPVPTASYASQDAEHVDQMGNKRKR